MVSSKILHYGDQSGQGGAALVRMASLEEAAAAVTGLSGQRLSSSGHALVVRFADSADIKAKKQAKQIAAQQQQLLATQPLHYAYAYSPLDSTTPSTLVTGPQTLGLIPGVASAPTAVAYPSMGTTATDLYSTAAGSAVMMPGSSTTLGSMGSMGSGPLGSSMSHHHVYQPTGADGGPLYMSPSDGAAVVQQSGHLMPGSMLQGAGPRALMAGPPTGTVAAISSLYVRNMPDNTDKLFLYEKFAPFGAILSVKVGGWG